LQDVLVSNVSELLDHPEDLVVDCNFTQGGTFIILTVYPHHSEVGKVIGRAGRNAVALRTLLESIAAKHGVKVLVEISDVKGQQGR